MDRRQFLKHAVANGTVLVAGACAAIAQGFSGKQMRLVVPFPAGGPTDIVARPLAQMLGTALNANLIVDNRGGAGGIVGADLVAKAAPDASSLLMATVGTHAINVALYKKLPYDPERDFTPVALVATAPVAVVVHPSQPVATLADLVALAKAKPGELNYGSAGFGTPGNLAAEMFKSAAGIDIKHVPYKGSAPAVTDLLGGHIQVMFDPLQSVLSNVQSQNLRALAVSSINRSRVLPDLPTIAESGFPGFECTAWWAVFAPASLSAELTASLAGEIHRIVSSDVFRNTLEPLGVAPTFLAPAALKEFQHAEIDKWGKAVRAANITMD